MKPNLRHYMRFGPPFVQIDGVWHLNVGFALAGGPDVPSNGKKGTIVLRRLRTEESALLKERRFDADLEVWAKITA